jgi:penicillin-binding protein 1A
MSAALHDRPKLEFRVPEGVSLESWACGPHECIDAFKPDQVPGAGGWPGDPLATASSDSGGQPGVESGVQMVNPDPDSAAGIAAAPKPATGTGVDSGVGGLY